MTLSELKSRALELRRDPARQRRRSHGLEGLHPAAALLQAHLRRLGRGDGRGRRALRRRRPGRLPRGPPLRRPRGLPLARRPRDAGERRRRALRTPCARSSAPTPTRSTASSAPPTGATRRCSPTSCSRTSSRASRRSRSATRRVSTDVLGDAYEYLIGKFADVTKRKKAGEFYTPRSVVRMMVDILDPKEGETIYDPACGTGGMLLGAIEHVQRRRRRPAHVLRQDLRPGEEPHHRRPSPA